MSRKSSIHFQPVSNVRFAVSHSERTDLSEPAYLLPKEHQLDNVVVAGSLSENELAALFIQQKEGMSRQAKTAGASPFWEGVVVLPNTDGKEQSANLKGWKKEYEQATGHKVLHMAVHLDEGYLDKDGKPQYNPHAHVIVSRMDSKNRVINLDRKQLAKVQDLTAEALKMERGSTLAERGGKRGRAHIGHKEFRLVADESRLDLEKPKADLDRLQKLSKKWSDDDLDKIKKLQAHIDSEPERLAAALAAQKIQLDDQYRLDRERMKQENAEALVAGLAKMYSQKDYQDLKTKHAEALADLKTELARAAQQAVKVPSLEAQATGLQAEITQLAPLAALVPDLKTKLAEAQAKADQVPQLEAQIAQLTPLAAKVQGLEMTLKSTQKKVDEMDEYTKNLSEKLADANKKIATALIAKAEAIEASVQAGIKSDAMLKTAEGHRVVAEKLTAKVADLTQTASQRLEQINQLGQAVAGANEKWERADYDLTSALNDAAIQATEALQLTEKLAASEEKLGKLEVRHETFKVKANTKIKEIMEEANKKIGGLESDLVAANALVESFKQARISKPNLPAPKEVLVAVDKILVEQARKRLKTAVGAPKEVQAPTPLPPQGKSISEAIKASWEAMLDWVKGKGGKVVQVQDGLAYFGPVVQLDDLHAVQHTGRGAHVIHELAKLDRVPALDDPKMEIKYRDGVGQVKGKLGQVVER